MTNLERLHHTIRDNNLDLIQAQQVRHVVLGYISHQVDPAIYDRAINEAMTLVDSVAARRTERL